MAFCYSNHHNIFVSTLHSWKLQLSTFYLKVRSKNVQKQYIYFIIQQNMKKFSLFLIAIVGLVFFVGCNKTPETTTWTWSLDTFAQCITDAGVKMYGTPTCSHCLAQKKLFGESFKYINYTDCIVAPTMCANVASIPTWLFNDGTTLVGEQSLAKLAERSKCVLPE